jgi:hypothetical protein
MSKKTHVAYMVTWTESERGWGVRSDGASLHLSQDDIGAYLKEYWDDMPAEAPYEYSRNDSETGTMVAISTKLYNQLKHYKNRSMRLWEYELRDLRSKGDLKE